MESFSARPIHLTRFKELSMLLRLDDRTYINVDHIRRINISDDEVQIVTVFTGKGGAPETVTVTRDGEKDLSFNLLIERIEEMAQ